MTNAKSRGLWPPVVRCLLALATGFLVLAFVPRLADMVFSSCGYRLMDPSLASLFVNSRLVVVLSVGLGYALIASVVWLTWCRSRSHALLDCVFVVSLCLFGVVVADVGDNGHAAFANGVKRRVISALSEPEFTAWVQANVGAAQMMGPRPISKVPVCLPRSRHGEPGVNALWLDEYMKDPSMMCLQITWGGRGDWGLRVGTSAFRLATTKTIFVQEVVPGSYVFVMRL